jgi:hypothetical protein
MAFDSLYNQRWWVGICHTRLELAESAHGHGSFPTVYIVRGLSLFIHPI